MSERVARANGTRGSSRISSARLVHLFRVTLSFSEHGGGEDEGWLSAPETKSDGSADFHHAVALSLDARLRRWSGLCLLISKHQLLLRY